MPRPVTRAPVHATRMLKDICTRAGITLQRLRGPDCSRPIAFKRYYVVASLREKGLSFHRIGQLINRDHSTCVIALQRFEDSVYTWHNPKPRARDHFLEAAE